MNGKLNSVLAGAYILLILLLLLQNCQGCDNRPTQAQYVQEPAGEEVSDTERARSIGADGDIKVTMLWDFAGDVDLHVIQPNGREIWFREMTDSSTGGKLDVDNTRGGRGSAENIYWRNPPEGRYVVKTVMYNISSSAPNGGTVRVIVKVNGEEHAYSVNLSRNGQSETVTGFYYTPQS